LKKLLFAGWLPLPKPAFSFCCWVGGLQEGFFVHGNLITTISVLQCLIEGGLGKCVICCNGAPLPIYAFVLFCLGGGLEKIVFGRPWGSILVPWGLDFCTLGHYVGDPGVHRDVKVDTLGSRVRFALILDGFWDPAGSRF
jgi:hypothetical protein